MLVQGAQVEAFEERLCERTGYGYAVVVSSGTAALYLALRAQGVGTGHRVFCPALSWPSPAHAARLVGATLRLVDIHEESWNSEASDVQEAAHSSLSTPALQDHFIAIDQFGNPCDLDAIGKVAGGALLLDAACSLGSSDPNRRKAHEAGSAPVACLSFHPRKVITTGEGGACLTDDEGLARALRSLRNHGQSAPGVFINAGHNFRLTEFAAALGKEQLERLDEQLAARRHIAECYRQAFEGALACQRIREGCRWNVQTFGVLVEAGVRDLFVERLRQAGVQAGILSYALSQIGSLEGVEPCPVAERVAASGVALPVFASMSAQQISQVVDAVHRCRGEFPGSKEIYD